MDLQVITPHPYIEIRVHTSNRGMWKYLNEIAAIFNKHDDEDLTLWNAYFEKKYDWEGDLNGFEITNNSETHEIILEIFKKYEITCDFLGNLDVVFIC